MYLLIQRQLMQVTKIAIQRHNYNWAPMKGLLYPFNQLEIYIHENSTRMAHHLLSSNILKMGPITAEIKVHKEL